MTDNRAPEYKVVLAPPDSSDPPTAPTWTVDHVIGITAPSIPESQFASPYDYGAVGDGLEDDTVAIQDWLNAIAGTAGYGKTGIFAASSVLSISAQTTIYGAGPRSFIIAKMPDFPPTQPLLKNANQVTSPTAAVDGNIFIFGCGFQGSQTELSSNNLIDLVGVNNVVFRNCIIRFHINPSIINTYLMAFSNASDVWLVENVFNGFGDLAATGPNGGGAMWFNTDCIRCHIMDNLLRDGTEAIIYYGAYGDISGNTIFACMEAGISGSLTFSTIRNNKISGIKRQNTSGHGMEIAGSGNLVDGNMIDSTDGASIYMIDPVLYTVVNNICRAAWLTGSGTGSALIESLSFTPSITPGYLTISNNICTGLPVTVQSGIAFLNFGSVAQNNVLCEGNVLSGSVWGTSPIAFVPDYTTVAGTNFMVRDNLGAADADYSTQVINFIIPAGTTGGFNVGGVGFKCSWIEFQAVLSFTGTCAASVGQQSWETGWDINSQVITTARSYFTATGLWWSTDGTDCASGDSSGRSSITVMDQLGHPICIAGVTALNNDGFFITINGAIAADVNNGGATYALGDTGTIDGGTTQATYRVIGVSGGVVTALAVSGGAGYTNGSGITTTTGGGQPGTGTGLTVDVFTGDPTTQEVVVNAICHA